ncbi:GNAT family N-acetyltransferase [Nocardiopsis ansamitocini]|uniref:N-acetyltransferase n=1 Tax=Nocardiopsis ansamitocini TaxID=1670832 RepID=A0A9W6UGZ9_9ACTN|nr:GNAT family N-acetyltransferase [Nocardiopsis ansamitocini]GLU48286.1 N-acetyltransferase [Nocardiopsis ansamitocini]
MPTITRLTADDFPDHVEDLASLLTDAVTSGASVGFLTPCHRSAVDWWRARARAVAEGKLIVWVCRTAEGIDGTVSLAPADLPNGRHRAEVSKLLVHRRARGGGLGRALLTAAEQAAVRAGTTLLLLDTQTDSPAEYLYRSAGWTRYGLVPDYARDPAGVLRDCSFYYKRFAP